MEGGGGGGRGTMGVNEGCVFGPWKQDDVSERRWEWRGGGGGNHGSKRRVCVLDHGNKMM